MAQEYIDQGIISSKADIFSLGVIIIEIITGRWDYPNISERTETSLRHYTHQVRLFSIIPYCNFLPYLWKCPFMINYLCKCLGGWKLEEQTYIEITPMHMSLEMCIQQVQQCISIALKCLEPESNKRPTSLDIVQSPNAVEPKCTSPGNPPSVIEKV